MDVHEKVRRLLASPDFNQVSLSKRLGVSQATISRWAKDEVSPDGHNRDAINSIYKQVLAQGDVEAVRQTRLVGRIGAGEPISSVTDGGLAFVDTPPGASEETVALEVVGDSMLPWLENGSLIYYSRQLPPEEMLNRRCVVQLADGRILVKTLRRGSTLGLYTLASFNAGDIEDVMVEWAAPIDWIKPRN